MSHRISGVDIDSPAMNLSIPIGSILLAINGEEVIDVVDYEYLTSGEQITLTWQTPENKVETAIITKQEYEPLGLSFSDDLVGGIRSCKNHCIFCFIDQMPRNVRNTLHVKDDDWRMSLIMGNYVTLTNVNDAEFERILNRKASPLYVSVHTLNPELRVRMMANPSAALINDRLMRLSQSGLKVHCQVVLCPGINDGKELENTLAGLCELYPCVQSVAVIPVGLTKFRSGMYPLRCLTESEAMSAISLVENAQKIMLQQHNERIVYASDELYLLAKHELPTHAEYEDFPQLENGVGLYRKLEYEVMQALSDFTPLNRSMTIDAITGTAIAPMLSKLYESLKPYGINVIVHPVVNSFFGETVTVAGLICAGDIVSQLKNQLSGELVIIPRSMLRAHDDVFLDGIALSDLSAALERKILPLCPDDGYTMLEELFSTLKEMN